MKNVLIAIMLLLIAAADAKAQEITAQPICFTIRNSTDRGIYGEIRTNYVPDESGQKIRHTGTFRLEAAGTTDPESGYPKDQSEFCSSGPFYPNRQLDLVLRTLFPVFECKTNIEVGEIVISSSKQLKDGQEITRIWATCY